MKKVIKILSIFLITGFIICFIVGLCIPVSSEVPAKSVFMYKLCNSLGYFLYFLPAMLFTAFTVSCSLYFGQTPQGSTRRFSRAMVKRFQMVLIVAVISSFVLTLSNEVIGGLITNKKNAIINNPKIIREYLEVGNNLYKKGLYERSLSYANAVLRLDPNSTEARDLKSHSDMEINRESMTDIRFDLLEDSDIFDSQKDLKIDAEQISDAYQCLLKAKDFYDKEMWFDAHYYAEIGVKLVSSKDPNLRELKNISADAWNNLTEKHSFQPTEDEICFNQKYAGYVALMEGDELQAYYIFRYLDENYPEMRKDNDVQFYLEEAQRRIEKKYFFIDETFELETFENVNDVYFTYCYPDGTKDLIYFKGATIVKATGQTVQYLRDFTIYQLKNNKWFMTLHVPYAKMQPVSVEKLSNSARSMIGIKDNQKFVPYILLKSIGRSDSSQTYGPTYTYANGAEATIPEYLIYPMEYDDFLLLEQSAAKPDTCSISTLFNLISKAEDAGYSKIYFAHTLLNRLMYPLFIIIVFVLLGAFGWDYRIGWNEELQESNFFRLSWIFAFPFFIFVMLFVNQGLMVIFKLINYLVVSFTRGNNIILAAILLYILFFVVASLYFVSRKNTKS
ncbi:MAG: hypothetical protein MJ188_06260 [Treponema sp.]|nr:hypothetical protein [Treponema sp.]